MKRPRRSRDFRRSCIEIRSLIEFLRRDLVENSCKEIFHRDLARRPRDSSRSCIEISHRGLVKRSCRELM